MKRWFGFAVGLVLVVLFAGGAVAQQMGWGMGPGMGWGYGPHMMGPGMGDGAYACPGMAQATPGAQITEDAAKQAAQEYADRYLKGFTVDKVLPFTGMRGMTMYSVELKGPQGEARTLHVNPWGSVMPFGGPWRRG